MTYNLSHLFDAMISIALSKLLLESISQPLTISDYLAGGLGMVFMTLAMLFIVVFGMGEER